MHLFASLGKKLPVVRRTALGHQPARRLTNAFSQQNGQMLKILILPHFVKP